MENNENTGKSIDIYKVCFKKYGNISRSILDDQFNREEIDRLKKGMIVVVDTKQGLELGFIVNSEKFPDKSLLPDDIMKILRIANQKEINDFYKIKYKEKKALKIARDKIKEHNLNMAVVDVKYVYDSNKTIFYFCAPNRVDFRELVRDLARKIRTKIELWQIGVKDAAKKIGGCGLCGMQTCCSRFLDSFCPISIKTPKIQDIAISPANVSGPCGRLLCCLQYEVEMYEKGRKNLPVVGEFVEFESDEWQVTERNIPLQSIHIVKRGNGDYESKVGQSEEVKRTNPLKDAILDNNEHNAPADNNQEKDKLDSQDSGPVENKHS